MGFGILTRLAGANKFMSSSGLENMKGATNGEGEEKRKKNTAKGEVKGEGKGGDGLRLAHYTQFAVRCEHINFCGCLIRIMLTFI